MGNCHSCGQAIEARERIRRADECLQCGRDLHCCRNCRHFDPALHNQCREVVAEWVSDKERANFCDYFDFASSTGNRPGGDGKSPEELAREKFRKLFKS